MSLTDRIPAAAAPTQARLCECCDRRDADAVCIDATGRELCAVCANEWFAVTTGIVELPPNKSGRVKESAAH